MLGHQDVDHSCIQHKSSSGVSWGTKYASSLELDVLIGTGWQEEGVCKRTSDALCLISPVASASTGVS
jgi:hypothetical protein